jgi:hypothetical protein
MAAVTVAQIQRPFPRLRSVRFVRSSVVTGQIAVCYLVVQGGLMDTVHTNSIELRTLNAALNTLIT